MQNYSMAYKIQEKIQQKKISQKSQHPVIMWHFFLLYSRVYELWVALTKGRGTRFYFLTEWTLKVKIRFKSTVVVTFFWTLCADVKLSLKKMINIYNSPEMLFKGILVKSLSVNVKFVFFQELHTSKMVISTSCSSPVPQFYFLPFAPVGKWQWLHERWDGSLHKGGKAEWEPMGGH